MTIPPLAQALSVATPIGWLFAGALLGTLYFLALQRNVRMLMRGQLLCSLGLQLVRIGVMLAALSVIARTFGALPLLSVALGVLLARSAIFRLGAPSPPREPS